MQLQLIDKPVFQIGFNRCGTKFLTEIFRRNGYEAMHWKRGRLAEDIIHSKHIGCKPLQEWKLAVFFGDMECCHRFEKPLLEAFKEFEFLHASFPNAYFILNLRDPVDWIASRCAHHGGRYIDFHAHHRNAQISDLPNIWMDDWHRHTRAVRRYFTDSPNFIEFNIDTDAPEKLAEFLADDYHISKFPAPNRSVAAQRKVNGTDALERVRSKSKVAGKQTSFESALIAQMVEHSLGVKEQVHPPSEIEFSGLFGHWDGDKVVRKKNGRQWDMVRCGLEHGDAFLTKETRAKIGRLQGTLNECLRLGRSCELAIDMQDARKFGWSGEPKPDRQILTYNRRPGARNLVLWPLPGYHDIGQVTYATTETPDELEFDQKRDAVGWRGNLSGRSGFHAGHKYGRPSHQILGDLISPLIDRQDEDKLTQELYGLPRFEFMMRHNLLPDFDLAFTLPNKFSGLDHPEKLGVFCGRREPVSWFYQFKYLVCLSGFDTGSNFFVAANSNSVVLKEEDGWELFYTSLFRPWEHYIPINVGGDDMQEKLDWARAHPVECKEMSKASRQICSMLANPSLRKEFLNCVLDGISSN